MRKHLCCLVSSECLNALVYRRVGGACGDRKTWRVIFSGQRALHVVVLSECKKSAREIERVCWSNRHIAMQAVRAYEAEHYDSGLSEVESR